MDGHFAYARSEAKKQNLVIAGASISATSGTFLLTDIDGKPIADAAMYNDGRAGNPLARAEKIISEVGAGTYLFAHTPEYIVAHLTGQPLNTVATDWSHAMKTGVDLHSKVGVQAPPIQRREIQSHCHQLLHQDHSLEEQPMEIFHSMQV
jgi:hypothetical protein